jgi:hypothetical protein
MEAMNKYRTKFAVTLETAGNMAPAAMRKLLEHNFFSPRRNHTNC